VGIIELKIFLGDFMVILCRQAFTVMSWMKLLVRKEENLKRFVIFNKYKIWKLLKQML